METLKKLKKVVLHACVIYTVILTAVYTLGAFVNSSWVPDCADGIFMPRIFARFVRTELIFVFGQARFRAQTSHSFYRVNFHFLYAIHRVGRLQNKRRLGFDCASRFRLCVCPLRCYCRNLQISHG